MAYLFVLVLNVLNVSEYIVTKRNGKNKQKTLKTLICEINNKACEIHRLCPSAEKIDETEVGGV
jgi:hypothetical protein